MVLGLGEATHGTREFVSLCHRLIEYLGEKRNFTVIGIETTFCDALALNENLLSGQGNAKQLLHALHYPLLDTKEILESGLYKYVLEYQLALSNTVFQERSSPHEVDFAWA
jgi:erythromycin esterase